MGRATVGPLAWYGSATPTCSCLGTVREPAFYKLGRSANNPEGQRILEHCLDLGVNFIDSSNQYGWGGAEVTLGKAVAGRRHEAVICDKLSEYYPPDTEDGERIKTVYTPAFILEQTDAALERLGTDYIDIYLLHHPVEDTPFEEIVDVMDRLVESGKVRYWGVSNNTGAQVERFVQLCQEHGKAPISGLENYYNLANTQHVEDLLPVLRRTGLGILTYQPHRGGNLLESGDSDGPGTPGVALLETVREASAELGKSVPQVCIAWVLSHPEITSALTCAESLEHVEDNLAGTRLELPEEALSALNAASDAFRESRAASGS